MPALRRCPPGNLRRVCLVVCVCVFVGGGRGAGGSTALNEAARGFPDGSEPSHPFLSGAPQPQQQCRRCRATRCLRESRDKLHSSVHRATVNAAMPMLMSHLFSLGTLLERRAARESSTVCSSCDQPPAPMTRPCGPPRVRLRLTHRAPGTRPWTPLSGRALQEAGPLPSPLGSPRTLAAAAPVGKDGGDDGEALQAARQ